MLMRMKSGRMFLKIAAFAFLACVLVATQPVAASAQDESATGKQQQTAQADKSAPPPILYIWVEDVKVAHQGTHEKVEQAYAQLLPRFQGARNFLAMKSVTGPNQAWFVEPATSLMDLQKEREQQSKASPQLQAQMDQLDAREANEVNMARGITLAYREDLSYKPTFDMPRMRYVVVNTYRIKPGHDDEFEQAAKVVRSTYDKLGSDANQAWAVYQAIAGAPAGTYYVMRPIESMEVVEPNANRMKAFGTALGEEGNKKLNQLMSDSLISAERNFFALDPKISYAPAEFAAADSFWAPSAQMAQAMGTSGKTATKKPAATKTGMAKKAKKDKK